PSVILLTALSPAAVAAAAVLVISATRALYHEWRLQHPPVVSVPAPPAGLFASTQLPVPHFWRDAAPALAISFCLQSGAAGLLLRKPLLAGVGFAMGLSIATLFALTSRASPSRPPQSLPRTALGVLLTIVLAIGLT